MAMAEMAVDAAVVKYRTLFDFKDVRQQLIKKYSTERMYFIIILVIFDFS